MCCRPNCTGGGNVNRRKVVFQGIFLLMGLGVFLLFQANANAQYRAGIQGVILDEQQNAIENATLTLTNLETGKSTQTTSASGGVYNFLSLPPGRYRIDTEAAGFKKKSIADVIVAGERTEGIDITLEVGDVTQTVTVTGDSVSPLDTESGNLTGTLNANAIQNLPSLGRDPFQLLRLAPGVFGDGAH